MYQTKNHVKQNNKSTHLLHTFFFIVKMYFSVRRKALMKSGLNLRPITLRRFLCPGQERHIRRWYHFYFRRISRIVKYDFNHIRDTCKCFWLLKKLFKFTNYLDRKQIVLKRGFCLCDIHIKCELNDYSK